MAERTRTHAIYTWHTISALFIFLRFYFSPSLSLSLYTSTCVYNLYTSGNVCEMQHVLNVCIVAARLGLWFFFCIALWCLTGKIERFSDNIIRRVYIYEMFDMYFLSIHTHTHIEMLMLMKVGDLEIAIIYSWMVLICSCRIYFIVRVY